MLETVSQSSERQADPLRKPKLDLYCILASSQEPMSTMKLLAEYRLRYNQMFKPQDHGFHNVHEFLQSFPDLFIAIHGLVPETTKWTASPSKNEDAKDMQELIRMQRPQGMKKYPVAPVNHFMPPAPINNAEQVIVPPYSNPAKTPSRINQSEIAFAARQQVLAAITPQSNKASNSTSASGYHSMPKQTAYFTGPSLHMNTPSIPATFAEFGQRLPPAEFLTGHPIIQTPNYTPPQDHAEERQQVLRSLHPNEINALLGVVREKGFKTNEGMRLPIEDSLKDAEVSLGSSIGGNSNPISYKQLLASLRSFSLQPSAEFEVRSTPEQDYILLKEKEGNKKTDFDGRSTKSSPFKLTSGAKRSVAVHLQRTLENKKTSRVPTPKSISLPDQSKTTEDKKLALDFDKVVEEDASQTETAVDKTGEDRLLQADDKPLTDQTPSLESPRKLIYSEDELRRLSALSAGDGLFNKLLQSFKLHKSQVRSFGYYREQRNRYSSSNQSNVTNSTSHFPISSTTTLPALQKAVMTKKEMDVENILRRLLISPAQKNMCLSAVCVINPDMDVPTIEMVRRTLGLDEK